MSDRPMVSGLAHVGIAVSDLEALLAILRVFGFEIVRRDVLEEDAVTSTIVRAGDVSVELLEPRDPTSPVASFIDKHGPGLHHLCLNVRDINNAITAARRANLLLLDETPRRDYDGRRAFVHPKSAGGVLIGLVEPS